MRDMWEYDTESLKEREELALLRLSSLKDEHIIAEPWGEYFRRGAAFLLEGGYEDLLPDRYDRSYTNPAFAVSLFGREMGRLLSFLAYELTGVLRLKAGGDGTLEERTILYEVFLEVYTVFLAAMTEEETPPESLVTDIGNVLYSFVFDYTDVTVGGRIRDMLCHERDYTGRLIMESDLSDISYLESFGEYVGEDTRELASFINSLPEVDINKMAETMVEGFIIGFKVTGKDISKKKLVNIIYPLGFERIVKAAMMSFKEKGLETVICRKPLHAATRTGTGGRGFEGEPVNRQMDYDHREDQALFLDKAFMERKLEVMRNTYEDLKEEASLYAGPVVMERFGMPEFKPVNHDESYALSGEQRALSTRLSARGAEIQSSYIRQDERSFTIISYPVPSIGKDFREIFKETVDINTLPYEKYLRMQQLIIEQLEKGESVEILGTGENRTRLRVMLKDGVDITRQSLFENCVADVNIPVGEVFTSPRLTGTDGVLHVSRVYLNGLMYRDLELTFKDGFITDYSCSGFEDEAENRRYIEENILHHHDTLPMGEFAIGTNTTAYAMAKRYGIFDKLPILIAEKTGPHFAVGDTCYSREEDVKTCNPDGRELVAKDNEHTARYRREDPLKAYFQCHTDITIPYEELGEIASVDSEGNRYPIISGGRFVVPGTEELNGPLRDFTF